MGKKKDKESLEQLEGAASAPPPPPGPLAPWKLSISVAASAALTGLALYDAAMTGVGVDMALLRSFGTAFFVWIAVGFVNKVLLQAQTDASFDEVAVPISVSPKPYLDERSGASESSTA